MHGCFGPPYIPPSPSQSPPLGRGERGYMVELNSFRVETLVFLKYGQIETWSNWNIFNWYLMMLWLNWVINFAQWNRKWCGWDKGKPKYLSRTKVTLYSLEFKYDKKNSIRPCFKMTVFKLDRISTKQKFISTWYRERGGSYWLVGRYCWIFF